MANLTPEAQHVLDALEAHFRAVRELVAGGKPEALAAVDKFAKDALGVLGDFVANVRGGAERILARENAGTTGSAEVGEDPSVSAGSSHDAGLSGDAAGGGAGIVGGVG